ncbi:ribonuclease P protein component [Paenibacillus protaetiae]|uniref:Ribonuclease P protein component n=1 Tax=Paenibacillus protaetiae TaxID=2509456 RepID=A0A4P6EWT2_9BACL|nr:ribonuclease P protein component [Paenibacillus protaetiae]QAY67494.1 ribonuclease P protein component [Paenibacillus protaetiae]
MHRKLRLKNRNDFNRVYRAGKSFANGQFVVYWSRQRIADPFRLGVSASKKIGNAVVRNRMRRVVKEIVRLNRDRIVPNIDFILIVRKPAVEMQTKDLERSVLHVLKRAGLLKNTVPPKAAKPVPKPD